MASKRKKNKVKAETVLIYIYVLHEIVEIIEAIRNMF
jgi:hypothetical protein